MKKCGKLLATLLVLALALTTIFAFTACFDDNGKKDAEYTIVFLDESDAELATVKVKEGVVPEFTGTLPAVPAETAEYTYSWGWDKEIVPATADATYKLTRVSTKRSYEVKFMNGETAVSTVTVEYGAEATLPENPTKDATVDKAYTFDGWYTQAEGGEKVTDFTITGATVYYAHFTDSARKYTVTFKNGDVVVSTAEVEYNDKATLPENPSKDATVDKVYAFDGWYTQAEGGDKVTEITVTGDVTYYAHFTDSARTYSITFKNGDTVLKTVTLPYGEKVTVPSDVTVSGYEIIGWEPELDTVSGDAEYSAIVARVLTQADKDNFTAILSADPNGNYVLGSDIDFAGANPQSVMAEFGGVLDGRGYSLKNLNLKHNAINDNYQAYLFARLSGTIKNIGLDYELYANGTKTSFVYENAGVVDNVLADVLLTNANDAWGVGLLVYTNEGTVSHSIVQAKLKEGVTGIGQAGAPVCVDKGGEIDNCYFIANGTGIASPYFVVNTAGVVGTFKEYEKVEELVAEANFTAEGWDSHWSVNGENLVYGSLVIEPVVEEQVTVLTQDDMAEFVNIINANLGGKYELGGDIDFGGADIGAIGEFTGVLDGKGYALKNFNPSYNGSTSTQWSYAVIAKNSGTIKNIIIDYSLKGNNGHEAFVYENAGLITNVYVKVKFITAGWANASLVGTNKDSGIVTNVVAVLTKDETVTNECFGAVVGSDQNGQIKYCYGVCGNVIPSANEVFNRPNFEGFGNGTYVGNANYDTLENLVAGATFNEADGWDMTYFAKTFKAVNDLKNA